LTDILPVFVGLHRFAVIVPGFGFAGHWVQGYRDEKLAMKDAVMRDYISKNQELFELPRKSNPNCRKDDAHIDKRNLYCYSSTEVWRDLWQMDPYALRICKYGMLYLL
jgi:NADH-ubiquinone oxidoreductase subunit b14.5b (NDUFC2)